MDVAVVVVMIVVVVMVGIRRESGGRDRFSLDEVTYTEHKQLSQREKNKLRDIASNFCALYLLFFKNNQRYKSFENEKIVCENDKTEKHPCQNYSLFPTVVISLSRRHAHIISYSFPRPYKTPQIIFL